MLDEMLDWFAPAFILYMGNAIDEKVHFHEIKFHDETKNI